MKKMSFLLLALIPMMFLPVSCKKDKEVTCTLVTAATQPPVDMNVTYKATQTGDGTISTLSYVNTTGTITISNPQLPWEFTVAVTTSTNVSISASGTVKNGSLNISYNGTSGGATIAGSDFCSQETN